MCSSSFFQFNFFIFSSRCFIDCQIIAKPICTCFYLFIFLSCVWHFTFAFFRVGSNVKPSLDFKFEAHLRRQLKKQSEISIFLNFTRREPIIFTSKKSFIAQISAEFLMGCNTSLPIVWEPRTIRKTIRKFHFSEHFTNWYQIWVHGGFFGLSSWCQND